MFIFGLMVWPFLTTLGEIHLFLFCPFLLLFCPFLSLFCPLLVNDTVKKVLETFKSTFK